jgi:hypothetical protein
MYNLYRCKECNEVLVITPYDHYPAYQYFPEEGIYKEKEQDDQKFFQIKHNGHHLERLRPIKGTMISERDYHEPVREIYFEATNGKEKFVIKKWRKNVNGPMEYELIHGYLRIVEYSCEVRKEEIKKEWQRVMEKPLQGKGDQFLEVLKGTVAEIKMSKRAKTTFDTSNPLISYQKLNQGYIQMVMEKLKNAFTSLELKEIRKFIHEQNQLDGVMPLLIRRRFSIERSEAKQERVEKSEILMPARIKRMLGRARPLEYPV